MRKKQFNMLKIFINRLLKKQIEKKNKQKQIRILRIAVVLDTIPS